MEFGLKEMPRDEGSTTGSVAEAELELSSAGAKDATVETRAGPADGVAGGEGLVRVIARALAVAVCAAGIVTIIWVSVALIEPGVTLRETPLAVTCVPGKRFVPRMVRGPAYPTGSAGGRNEVIVGAG